MVDLAGQLDLSKGTVHGLLRTLACAGFVEQDEETGKYKLGAAMLHIGYSYLDGNELRARSLNWADSLAARTGEAVRVGILHDSEVLIVHHVFRPNDGLQALDIGSLMPAHASAMGKVLIAGRPSAGVELADRRLAAFTEATITERSRLTRELARIRKRGWSSEIGELSPDQMSIAAGVIDRRGLTVGAIAVSGTRDRLLVGGRPRAELVGDVREAARAVSRELGAIPW